MRQSATDRDQVDGQTGFQPIGLRQLALLDATAPALQGAMQHLDAPAVRACARPRPGGNAAVQHYCALVTEPAQHPPQARGERSARIVVRHHSGIVAHAVRRQVRGELMGCRKRVTSVAPVLPAREMVVKMQETSAGGVAATEGAAAVHRIGEIVAAVVDAQVGVAQVLHEFAAAYQRGVGLHAAFPKSARNRVPSNPRIARNALDCRLAGEGQALAHQSLGRFATRSRMARASAAISSMI